MVDFRYHLVSLVAVFLALAVGIILGAGPLQNSIGQALNSQVQSLSENNDQLKAENLSLAEENSRQSEAIAGIAPSIVGDTLTGYKVAVVTLPKATDEEISAARSYLADAGAEVVGQYTINDVWTSAAETAYRETFASQAYSYIDGVDADTPPNAVLASGFADVVFGSEPAANLATLRELFTGSDKPLMSIAEGGEQPADAVVFIEPQSTGITEESSGEEKQQAQYSATTYAELTNLLSAKGPTVLSGAASDDTHAGFVIRSAGYKVSTVDNIPSNLGSVNVVVALAHTINGQTVHLGFDEGASAGLGARTQATKPAAVGTDDRPAATDEDGATDEEPATDDPSANVTTNE